MDIQKIEIIKDDDISTEDCDFYTVQVNGETILECVAGKDVGAAITEFMRSPTRFADAFM